MTSKVISALFVFVIAVGSAETLQAQRGVFRGGVTQPAQPQPQPRPQPPALAPAPPVARFVAAPVQPSGYIITTPPITPPIITTTYSPIYSNFPSPAVAAGGGVQRVHPSSFYGFGVPSVVAPNTTVISNTTVIVQQPVPQIVVPGRIGGPVMVNPVSPFQTPLNPLIGVPRARVIEQFGSPVASIVTQHTEMLYFSGGVSIFLQDGQVATPPRPY
jgi:hypothetical protein